MKTIKNILIFAIIAVSFASCTKDEDGQWIRYYKQPTGEGYVFVKNADGTITPLANEKDCITLEASGNEGSGIFSPSWKHTDYYSTDANGKFTCKFVRKIDRHDVQYYRISFSLGFVLGHSYNDMYGGGDWTYYYCIPNNFSENELITIDTIYLIK